MTRTLLVALAAPLLPSLACMPAMMAGHAAAPVAASPATPPAATADAALMQTCPMVVPGTQVAVSNTAAGEALTFTTASGDVAELRRRVHAMAEMHDRHHATGAAMEHGHGDMGHGGGMMGPGMMGGGQGTGGHGTNELAIPPSRAAVEDVGGGARIVVTPDDPADLEKLRSAVRMHAKHMQEHGCQMTGM